MILPTGISPSKAGRIIGKSDNFIRKYIHNGSLAAGFRKKENLTSEGVSFFWAVCFLRKPPKLKKGN